MERLTTYIHDAPVRNSDVSFAQIIRKLAKYEDTDLTPEAVGWLLDQLDETKEQLVSALLELEEYKAEGSLMLFRLLKYNRKNSDIGGDGNGQQTRN